MKLSTPAAIVIAGALVGAGLFFGLRTRPPEPAPATRPVVTPRETVRQQAQEALAAHQAEVARACEGARVDGERARVRFDYTFAPDGRQLARGVLVDAASPRLLNCIQGRLPLIRVPAPGANTRVEVVFEL